MSSLLEIDSNSEAGLTAIADLALIASVLERDDPECGATSLVVAIRTLVDSLTLLWGQSRGPGPEWWAMHVARACLDSAAETRRLLDPKFRVLLKQTRQMMLDLGPSWRPEEVAYLSARLGGSRLPRLRAIPDNGSNASLYELAHVVFYATDFGSHAAVGTHVDTLAKTATEGAKRLADTGCNWDLGVETVLAGLFLSDEWSPSADRWIGALIPALASEAVAELRGCGGLEKFIQLYHPMGMAALTLARAARYGR